MMKYELLRVDENGVVVFADDPEGDYAHTSGWPVKLWSAFRSPGLYKVWPSRGKGTIRVAIEPCHVYQETGYGICPRWLRAQGVLALEPGEVVTASIKVRMVGRKRTRRRKRARRP